MTDIDPMRLVGHLKNLLRYDRASVSPSNPLPLRSRSTSHARTRTESGWA
jgi:hypothetical protein